MPDLTTAPSSDGPDRLARLIDRLDWGATPLGPRGAWPQSLRTVVDLLLTSRFAMWMSWGPALTFLYNDAYAPTLGVKHPASLGRPSREVWAEIWPVIGPRIAHVLETGEATWDEALLLFLERRGYREETYHTFSYSPLRDEGGVVAGHLCVVSEDTERVIGTRRLATLRDLSAALADAPDERAVLDAAGREFARNRRDLPFALLYLFPEDGSPDGASPSLAVATGFDGLPVPSPAPWSAALGRAAEAGPITVALGGDAALPSRGDAALPCGDWDVPPREACVLPVGRRVDGGCLGVLVAAFNPHRRLDATAADFLSLLAGQVGAAIATARERAAERRRAEALAELDRAKTAFFSNVSHELRTPLTLILGPLAEALEQAPPPIADMLGVAHRNARRLRRLVNTLLDVSRIEAGRAEARFVPVDLGRLTAELAGNFSAAMERAGLRFTVETEALAAPVPVDPTMWEKIVLNLVSNAFKFTRAGEVAVALRLAGPDAVELTVRDTGEGIPAAQLDRVFERFHRVEGTRGRSHEGTGIGLALVRDLVSLHGGTVEVESTPGEGSLFRVRLPARQDGMAADAAAPGESGLAEDFAGEAQGWVSSDDAETLPPATTDGDAEAFSGRILLADDNADMRDYVRRLLVGVGHAVATVNDGEAALDLLRGGAGFDLLISDVMMPRLDGLGLLRAIRADPVLKGLAVILLSARAGEEVRLEGIAAQADAHLAKPFSPRELVARVAATLAASRAHGEALAALTTRVADRTAERDRLWELSEDLLVRKDFTGHLLQVSPSWARVLGLTREAVATTDYWALVHPDDRAHTREALETMRRTASPVRFENRLLPLTGADPVSVAWALSPDREGADQVLGIGRDVTAERRAHETLLDEMEERERVEATLRQMQRLEAVGQLTAGVAHDFNNLLTVVLSSLEVLEAQPAPGAGGRQIAMIRSAARRGADLTAQLLAFSRQQHLEPRALDLNETIGGMTELLRTTVGDTIAVRTVFAPDLWRALADQTQIELAVLNLAINARDAMEGGGTLTIETAHATLGPPASSEAPAAGDYVTVSVSDTGAGIAPAVFERVFEPFFTTKAPGKGSGLGLPQVYGFARQSGGAVNIRTAVGVGTTVCVFLPRACGGPAADAPA